MCMAIGLILLFVILPLQGWCNTCLEGLPSFQENKFHRRAPSQQYEWLIPTYRFTAQGNITEWQVYITDHPRGSQEFDLTLQVWTTTPDSRCLESSMSHRLYCLIGRNMIRPDSGLQVANRLLKYKVQPGSRIGVREGDIVGLHVSVSSRNLNVQSSSNLIVDILEKGRSMRPQPAPILTALLDTPSCTMQTGPRVTTDLIPTSTTGTLALDTDPTTSGDSTWLNPPSPTTTAPTTTAPYKIKFIMSLAGIAVLIGVIMLLLVIVAVTCWRLKRKRRNNSVTSQTVTELQDADSVYYSEIGYTVPPDRQVGTSKYKDLLDKGTNHTSKFLMKKNSAYTSTEAPGKNSAYTSTEAPGTTDCDDVNVSMNYAYKITGRKIPNYKYSMEANIAYGTPSRT